MASIDRNSDTWRQVAEWAAQQRQEAVEQLVAGGARDERLRGRIEQIDDLLSLASEPGPTIPSPDY